MSNRTYRPDIDGLRAIAVLPVLAFHAALGVPGGYVGVDVFFVISGYLITSLILRELDDGRFRLSAFWERRIRRLLPPLLVVLVASLIAGWRILLPEDYRDLGRSIVAQACLSANIWFWQQDGYFAAPSESKPLLHLWSLAVEEQFYLLLPFLLLLLHKFGRKILFGSLVVLAAGSLVLSEYGSRHTPGAAYFLLPYRAWELLLGSILGMVRPLPASWRWPREMLSWGGLAAIGYACVSFDRSTPFPGLHALIPCLGAAAVLFAGESATSSPPEGLPTPRLPSLNWLLATFPFRGIGLISYSLYLWHWPILVLAKHAWAMPPRPAERATFLAISFVAAVATWALVEFPFRARLVLARPRPLFALGGACLAMSLAVGLTLARSNGLPNRFSAETLRYAAEIAAPGTTNYQQVTVEEVQAGKLLEVGGPPDSPIYCVVWGDSHAMVAFPIFKDLADQTHQRCVAATYTQTPPLLGYQSNHPFSLRQQSHSFNQGVMDFVRRNKVPHVVLMGFWQNYDFGEPDSPEFLQAKDAFRRTIDEITQTGAEAWIVKPVPAYSEEIPRMATRLSMFGIDLEMLRQSRATHQESTSIPRALIESVQRRNVHIVDPEPLFFAQDHRSIFQQEGQLLYRDSNHLSRQGAELLKPILRPIFSSDPPLAAPDPADSRVSSRTSPPPAGGGGPKAAPN